MRWDPCPLPPCPPASEYLVVSLTLSSPQPSVNVHGVYSWTEGDCRPSSQPQVFHDICNPASLILGSRGLRRCAASAALEAGGQGKQVAVQQHSLVAVLCSLLCNLIFIRVRAGTCSEDTLNWSALLTRPPRNIGSSAWNRQPNPATSPKGRPVSSCGCRLVIQTAFSTAGEPGQFQTLSRVSRLAVL